jgi:Ca2+-binding EF-hand superfamily protein
MRLTITLLLSLTLCSLALAQPSPDAPGSGRGTAQFGAAIKAADKNGDGKITKEEAGGAAWFDRLDQNKDGAVDAAELEIVRKAMGGAGGGAAPNRGARAQDGGQLEALVKSLDKNGDGKITKEEAGGAPWFDRVDHNKDGVIDAAELEMVRKAMSAGGAAAGSTPSRGAGKPGRGRFEAMLKSLDKNGDGKITKEEAGGAPWFDRLDQNKDGVVDAAELDVVRKAMGAGGASSGPASTQGAGKPGGGQLEAMLKSLDKNADGKITKEEAGGAAWFDRLDQNQDGVVDAAELEVVRKARAAGGGVGGTP